MTPTHQPRSGGKQAENELRGRLRERLLGISYPAFGRCVQRLLTAMGYSGVLVEREHFRGRNSSGGWDLEATARTGVTTAWLIAQVKQYREPVQKRYVDELRGTMLRADARHGLLITTSGFSPAARQAAAAGRIAPIRLVDGPELLNLLIRHKVGVRENASGTLETNEAFFDRLTRRFPAQRGKDHQATMGTECAEAVDLERGGDRNAAVLVRITFGKEGP
jgi:restriction endonuclease Mrr